MTDPLDPNDLFPLLGVVLGLVLAGVGVALSRFAGSLRQRGVRVPGIVVDARELPAPGSRTSNLYQPIVRYLTTEGRLVTTGAALASRLLPPRRGRPVTVLYDPARPTTAGLAGALRLTTLTSAGFAACGGVVAAVSIAVLFGA